MADFDTTMMRHALALAQQGRGTVEPNPMVGAVIVRGHKIVGEGWHQRFGGPHAEVHALQKAGREADGATLYVTLEPCCHHGKTPPCTDAIVKAGIRRVVVAGPDPFPEVSGGGLALLRQAGVDVAVGLLRDEAEELNAPYFKLQSGGLPYVIAKWAMTLDGRIATANFDSKWITGEASRALSHELRGRMDAIVVGIGTVLADDPLLTARPAGRRQALRVVLDSHLRLPLTSQLVRTVGEYPLLVCHQAGNKADKEAVLRKAGCETFAVSAVTRPQAVREVLTELGRRRLTNVLVEGGATVLGACFDARVVDEVWTFIAPKWIGATDARSAVCGTGVSSMAEAGQLRQVVVQALGDEVLIRGRVLPAPTQATCAGNSAADRHGN